MKNIAFLVDQLIKSGPENIVLDICSHIDRKRFTPIIFSLKDESSQNSIEADFKELGITIVHFSSTNWELELKSVAVANEIHKKCIELNVDILHAHTYHPTIIAANIRGVKKVVTIHNISGEDYVYKKGFFLGLYMMWRFNRSLSKFTQVITISDYMTQYYDKICGNIHKISNGVSVIPNNLWDVRDVRRELSVDDSRFIITIIGSVSKRKNVEFALRELIRSKSDFLCLVIGAGDRLDYCKEITKDDCRFRFEGFKDNVQKYLFVSNLYISASLSEGLPLSVLEALNVGVPCALSDIPPHREIVETMSVPGLSVFSLSDNSLCRTLSLYYSVDYDKRSISERAHYLYSSQVMTKSYQDIYEEI